jgi:cysteine desulfurase
MRHIYLDYNTTTPLAPAVQEAMIPFLAEFYGAPTGSHWLARASSEAMEDARSRVGLLLGVQRDEIVFTSGATESVNFALKGIVLRHRPVAAHLVITAVDHSCVREVAEYLETWGCGVSIVPVTGQGVVTAAAIESALQPETVLVSVPHVVGETGVIQPVRAIAEVCRRNNVLLHLDAAQSAGRIPLNAQELDVDLLSLSGHKMYAPKGTGVLYVRHGLHLEPLIHGVGHEAGYRGGVQHVAGIVGLGRAANLVRENLDSAATHLTKLRERLLGGLCATLGEALPVYGDKVNRAPGVLCVGFPEVVAEDLLARANEICAQSMTTAASLLAMGVSATECRSAVRFSLGWYTTEEEIDRTISTLSSAWESIRS